MGNSWKSGLGWIAAAVIAVAWFSSDGNEKTHISPPQLVMPAPRVAEPKIDQPKQSVPTVVGVARPSQPVPPLPSRAEPEVLYTKSRVNMRSEPNVTSGILQRLDASTQVRSAYTKGAWHYVFYLSNRGWIHGDFLTDTRQVVEPETPAALAEPPRPPRAISRSGQPSRGPYVGTCDCPYDLMRNGRACGGRSAYSKPGGRNPVCYF